MTVTVNVRAVTYSIVLAAVLAMSITTAVTTASAADSPRPPERVVTYQPRIVTHEPRIVDVAPKPTPGGVTVTSDVLFAFGSATLSPGAQQVLGSVVTTLRSAPAGRVVVTGYTDSIGTPASNLALSAQRATAVVAFLNQGVARPQLTYQARGLGESNPVAPNTVGGKDNPAGRAQNRRVTITVPS